MLCEIRLFTPCIFKQVAINNLIVLMLIFPLQTQGDQNENSLAYHQLISRIFPGLDTALFETLEHSGTTCPESDLKDITIKTYEKWHVILQEIRNTPVPVNAKLLTEQLSPDGFSWITKSHIYEPPVQEGYSEAEFVIHYFLQIIGTVIKENHPLLQPLQEELLELFQCNYRDCEKLAGITEISNDPISSSDKIKLQHFVECTRRSSSFSVDKRNDFCAAFLLHTSF